MIIAYDRSRRRVHVLGRRCHHGLLGITLLAAGLMAPNPCGPVLFGLGAALCFDDRSDVPWLPVRPG